MSRNACEQGARLIVLLAAAFTLYVGSFFPFAYLSVTKRRLNPAILRAYRPLPIGLRHLMFRLWEDAAHPSDHDKLYVTIFVLRAEEFGGFPAD
jgi:hypothetical protein